MTQRLEERRAGIVSTNASWRALRSAWRGNSLFTFDLHEDKHVVWTSASLRIAIHACLHDSTDPDSLFPATFGEWEAGRSTMFTVFPKALAASLRRTPMQSLATRLQQAVVRVQNAQSSQPDLANPSLLIYAQKPSVSVLWEGFLTGIATGDDVHFVFGENLPQPLLESTFCPTGRAAAACLYVTLDSSSFAQEPPMQDKLSDHLDMALFPCDGAGLIVERPNRRAFEAFGALLGSAEGDSWRRSVSDLLFKSERDRESFRCTFEQFVDDILPFDFIASMLPKLCETADVKWALTYHPLHHATQQSGANAEPARAPGVLVVARPLEQNGPGEGGDGDQAYIKALLADIDVSKGFLIETNAMISSAVVESDIMRLGRTLHTIKGNCGCFAMTAIAKHVHHLEDLLAGGLSDEVQGGLAELQSMWNEKIDIFQSFLKEDDASVIITKDEFDELNMDLMSNRDWSEILGVVQKWSMELVDVRFRRLELQLERFVATAEKEVKVVLAGKGTRLPRKGLQDFWASLVHILRNVVDHGLDSREERTAAGKTPVPTVTFGVKMTEDDAIISISDDGRGIAWEKVGRKALERGLPAATRADLADALFAQGLSTQESVSISAGRGVGLSAVKDELTRLEGKVTVTSEAGTGTEFSLSIPLATLANLQLTAM